MDKKHTTTVSLTVSVDMSKPGTVQIIKMHIQGVPLGTAMYEGSLHKWGTDPDNASRGVLDMTSPSSWRYPLRVPATNKYWGVGFA